MTSPTACGQREPEDQSLESQPVVLSTDCTVTAVTMPCFAFTPCTAWASDVLRYCCLMTAF